MKSERLQILIEPAQRERLERTAHTRGVSVGSLVRDALEVAYPPHSDRRASAAREILSATPMDVPDVDELLAELDDLRGRRA